MYALQFPSARFSCPHHVFMLMLAQRSRRHKWR
jgi:hypothetical protein